MTAASEDSALVSLLQSPLADALPVVQLGYFLDLFPARRAAVAWVVDYIQQYGSMPRASLVAAKFPAVKLMQKADPLLFRLEALRTEYVETVIYATSQHLQTSYLAKDFRKYLDDSEVMCDRVRMIQAPVGDSAEDPDLFTALKIAKVKKDAATVLRTFPTGLAQLDAELGGGLTPGVYTIASTMSLGKTYLALWIAEAIRKSNARVLFVTLEMGTDAIQERDLCVRFGLNVDQYILRKQPDASKAKGESLVDWYTGILEVRQRMVAADTCPGKIFVRGTRGVPMTPRVIAALVRELAIDVVIIDAAQDLKPTGMSKEITAGLYMAIEQLNDLSASRNLPVLMTVQFGGEVEKKNLTKGLIEQVAWGRVFAQKSDVMLSMLGNRGDGLRDMEFQKARDGQVGRPFKLEFKFPFIRIETTGLSSVDTPISPSDIFGSVDAATAALTPARKLPVLGVRGNPTAASTNRMATAPQPTEDHFDAEAPQVDRKPTLAEQAYEAKREKMRKAQLQKLKRRGQ